MDRKLQSKEVEIEKMLTPDMAKAIDMLAYAFLKSKGYDTSRCELKDRKGAAARKRLQKALENNGVHLEWHLPTSENKIFCYFTLHTKNGTKIATSRSIEFICQIIDVNKNGGSGDSE